MKLLVMSDSHGAYDRLDRAALKEQPDMVLFLGDGLYDLTSLRLHCKAQVLAVRGNCDVGAKEEATREIKLDGVKIFMTHGHLYDVKYGYDTAINAAGDADVLLFGHTHIPVYEKSGALHVLNPGSIRSGRYAVIEIQNGEPSCRLKSLEA